MKVKWKEPSTPKKLPDDDLKVLVSEKTSKGLPVEVEEVDVVCLQFSQAGVERNLEGFGVVTLVIRFYALWTSGKGHGEFGGKDDFVAVVASSHPFAEPGFGFFVLVVVGGVDEVAAVLVEEVEDFE